MIKVALHSEDHALHPLLASVLGKEFQFLPEANADEIENAVLGGACDVLILDLHCSRDALKDRMECWQRLISLPVPSIIMSDDSPDAKNHEFIGNAPFGYCRRPPSIRDLKSLLKSAHESSTLKQQRQAIERQPEGLPGCDQLIGTSPVMHRVFQLVRSVTNLNATVLVTGESGTGKELVARAIHNLGSRSTRPFVAVSCGAIPETLIESELFGHTNGAFTGTTGDRAGYLEMAGDGTLFFDEIGELSLSTQVKLLRVLQQMEFSRLGSTRLIPLRARLIFATNQDLARLVLEGKFRQDLFYRINVIRIETPALQDRPEDIPSIAMHFLGRYAKMFGKPMETIEPNAMKVLRNYSWPGNVRELENAIQRAIVKAPGRTIREDDLDLGPEEENAPGFDRVLDIADYLPAGDFERLLREYKIKLAWAAVRKNKGNKTMAARNLGISRAYLYELIAVPGPGTPYEQSTGRAAVE